MSESCTEDAEVIAATAIAASSGCAARYSKGVAPSTRPNAGCPVTIVCHRSPQGFQMKSAPKKIVAARNVHGASLRSVSLNAV
jgi:hypothetical protein